MSRCRIDQWVNKTHHQPNTTKEIKTQQYHSRTQPVSINGWEKDPVYLIPIIRVNRDQGREISETTAGIHSWIQSEEPTAIDRRPNIIRVHTCLLSNMNHPAYTTSTLCRTLSADHNTMINALNSLYSFIPPSLSIKLTSRSLSKLKFGIWIKYTCERLNQKPDQFFEDIYI